MKKIIVLLISLLVISSSYALIAYYNENIEFGNPNCQEAAPDFQWDNINQKLKVRAMFLNDLGDSPEIGFRRAGPDNATCEQSPEAIGNGVQIAPIYWQAWGTNGDFDALTGSGQIAQINARTEGEQTGTSRPGALMFSTTPVGEANPRLRLFISSEGEFWIWFSGDVRKIIIGDPNSCGVGKRCLAIDN